MNNIRTSAIAFVMALSLSFVGSSCKNKAKTDPATDSSTQIDSNSAVAPGPEISQDDTLSRNVQDAIKDYPGVQATVNDGEVMLSGTIERSKWLRLKPTLDGLHPKKVTSDQLTIK